MGSKTPQSRVCGCRFGDASDRLSRSQIHIAVLLDDIERAVATLEFVTEDFQNIPVGRLIFNIRAFAGEVEREKVVERTMRGKLERARVGKLPQGTGKGCYGHRYNSETGRRVNNVARWN
jgi:site-specific DNA recombinase